MSDAIITTLAEVAPERVEWLWDGRLPAGKLVVLDGDPGAGKTTLSLDIAARLSDGRDWPDGGRLDPVDVLLASAEDGLADTIRPRLDAAGADVTRVHAITNVSYVDEAGATRLRSLTLADTVAIESAIRRYNARLLVIDVLMAFWPSRVDTHRDSDVRSVLSDLARVADRTGCAVLLLRHLNKGGSSNPLYRGGGSIGIVGAARCAMIAATDPDDESRRVLAVTKSNLAATPTALAYRLVDAPEHGCARIEWLGESAHQAGDLLDHNPADHGERDEAVDWLRSYLEDNGGEVQAADALRDAIRDGISKTTLHRARKKAGIVTSKGGLRGGWLWRLSLARFQEDSEDSRSQNLEPSESWVEPSTPVEIGPCAKCGDPTRRYGDGGSPLCATCRSAS